MIASWRFPYANLDTLHQKKKIMVEEGHSIPNLIHVFQLIVRHLNLFYNCRI